MESIARKGTVPWGNDPNYKVFRNVVADYGAKGDGKTDDTAAIQNAMNDGKRCGENCHGSTTKNAIVYFPPGTYLVSKTIEMPFGTQLIGDAVNRPTILAASRFIGLGVISTDKYTGGGAGSDGLDEEYYVNTANFYRQIRNVIIDVSGTRPVQGVSGVHYQVAQATSMQNVDIIAKTGTNQRGMFAENGSGGQISDVNFKGGNFCIYGGNQQFTAQRLTFDGCDTAVRTIWDWGWIWKSITVKNTRIGFQLLSDGSMTTSSSSVKASSGNIGSASFVDSNFVSVGTAVMIAPLNSAPGSGSTGVILENVGFSGVTVGVADSSGKTILAGGDQRLKEWATGPMYLGGGRRFVSGETVPAYPRQATLLDTSKPNSPYYERARPQYETRSASDFVHLKDLGAKGDGITDDTAAVQRALDNNIGRILFVDAGTYILTDTVTIPAGSILVGETWSQFAASGDNFKDATKPRVMLRVGRYSDIGSVEMQDLIFTTQGPTAGAILVEWNIKAGSQGSAALWDCHARVGGAIGTKLTDKECPAITTGTDPGCQGASMLFHLTTQASGYFENMWLWTADHNIDDVELSNAKNPMIQNSVYSARGMLIESREATWLYGTASEHSVCYQYNFNGASNIYAGMVQTESPYYQPVPKPPEPFANAVGQFAGDPTYRCGNDFDGCDASWAIIVRKSENIHFAGAGVYSWFSSYTQDCIDSQTCQKALILAEKNKGNVRFQHLITIGAKYMIVQDGKGITAADNLNVKSHPRWSQISILDLAFVKADHQSPFSATVIPLPHTTVPPRSTLTLSEPIQSDIVQLPYNGNQNDAPGPGVSSCSACSFFRLITSTCCGTGGSLGNPLLIPKGVTTYIPIELPAGFVPGQAFVGQDGVTYPKGVALPRNVIIPVGTTFANGFTIPAGQALASGEDNGPPPGDLIWIDPKIWQQPNPKVACDIFPCTFKFPPWTGATSTLDYPKMTVTNGTFTTTITRGPITITEWIFDPYTISAPSQSTTSFAAPQATTTSSTTVAPIFFIWPPPRFGSTSTWPWVTYTQSGIVMSTRPPTTGSATGGKGTGGGGGVGVVPTPHPPPPPPGPSPPPPPTGSWPVATITVYPLRPSPTVHDCDFPDPECPNPPGKTDGPGFTMPEPQPGEVDDDDEDDDEEEGTCPLVSNGGGSGSGGSGGSGSGGGGGGSGGGNNGGGGGGSSSPTPTYNNPDPAPAAKTMSTFGPGYTAFAKKNPNGASIRIEFNFEVLAGCAWKFDMEQCRKYFRVPIDSCNCNGFDGKQGGVARNNCLAWRVDPNTGT
ncbi:glycoside hydrolase family 55 protein [Dissoconium aciculare CBS 342.82]|uniref:Glycoside hydrolase family 55 protein n=1 Tax=Dissoconium aciculare CBS 342.82 TaxID=1314786 RepID=A0A6J3LSZ4_9PEZI|nr:glycoside hydrolase family 55 protein [Dissoconium aciculare CBS 342.82]KAF1817732.1 glycoside hydrolase family 55 protein [Dissoconium aciculare CBS 342.82]